MESCWRVAPLPGVAKPLTPETGTGLKPTPIKAVTIRLKKIATRIRSMGSIVRRIGAQFVRKVFAKRQLFVRSHGARSDAERPRSAARGQGIIHNARFYRESAASRWFCTSSRIVGRTLLRAFREEAYDTPCERLLNLAMSRHRLRYACGWIAIPVVSAAVPYQDTSACFDRSDQIDAFHGITNSPTLRAPGT